MLRPVRPIYMAGAFRVGESVPCWSSSLPVLLLAIRPIPCPPSMQPVHMAQHAQVVQGHLTTTLDVAGSPNREVRHRLPFLSCPSTSLRPILPTLPNFFASSDPRPNFVRRGGEVGYSGFSGTLGATGGLAAAVCRVGVVGMSVLEI